MFLLTTVRRIPSQMIKGCVKHHGNVFVSVKRAEFLLPIANFSKIRKWKTAPTKTTDSESALAQAPPPPAPVPIEEAWVEVKDNASGQIYWWNTVTNETTALGAPRPTGPTALAQPQQQQGGMGGGLGSVVAEGFAFGAGSAVAHRVVGSFFGGGGGHSDSGGDVSDDSFDI